MVLFVWKKFSSFLSFFPPFLIILVFCFLWWIFFLAEVSLNSKHRQWGGVGNKTAHKPEAPLFFSPWELTSQTETATVPSVLTTQEMGSQPGLYQASKPTVGSAVDCINSRSCHCWPSGGLSCGKSSSSLIGGMSPTLWNKLHTHTHKCSLNNLLWNKLHTHTHKCSLNNLLWNKLHTNVHYSSCH